MGIFNFNNGKTDLIIPTPSEMLDVDQFLRRTTHLGIGTHPDDNEIMAYNGIGICYDKEDRWFTGVVITKGEGGTKEGPYKDLTNEELARIRHDELLKAAKIGNFLALVGLNYTSQELKKDRRSDVRADLIHILDTTRPEVVYINNLFDAHDTHLSAALRSIEALRDISPVFIPQLVYGCEITESLDWCPEKIQLDVSMYPEVAHQILYIFQSQSENNRNYPHATISRWESQATFDRANKYGPKRISYAMDLTTLIKDKGIDLEGFIQEKTQSYALRKIRNLKEML